MNNQSGYEIDFLPVGSGERSGDAIAIRYGTPGNYKVMVYDGGTQESGQALVDHIKKYYGTNRVDYVVSSHPDADHASGLSVVLEELEVGELWMHQPWKYSAAIQGYFHDQRITSASLAERLKTKMAAAYALEELAIQKGIPVREPFRGVFIGDFVVLSPDQDWYVHTLIPEFEKSPEQKKSSGLMPQGLRRIAQDTLAWLKESWGTESLREDVETSAENESSVILFGTIEGRGILLTGDAGVRALKSTADYAESRGVSIPSVLNFVQVPHHGSRHNVSSTVLDRIVGSRKAVNDGQSSKTAFVSAGKESKTHPRKIVTNAFIRRGVTVFATQGGIKWNHFQMPARNWGLAAPVPFSNEGESWE